MMNLDPSFVGTALVATVAMIGVWLNIRKARQAVKADIAEVVRQELAARESDDKGATRTIRPQPLEVKPHVRLATHEEVSVLAARVFAIEQRIEHQYREIGQKAEERAVKLHERINLLVDAVGQLRGEIKRL